MLRLAKGREGRGKRVGPIFPDRATCALHPDQGGNDGKQSMPCFALLACCSHHLTLRADRESNEREREGAVGEKVGVSSSPNVALPWCLFPSPRPYGIFCLFWCTGSPLPPPPHPRPFFARSHPTGLAQILVSLTSTEQCTRATSRCRSTSPRKLFERGKDAQEQL